jgi:superfamily II DNA or RNA helicase
LLDLINSAPVDRFYQLEAVDAAFSSLAEFRSSLIVMATGTGKTRVLSRVAARWPGSVLVLAHRNELVDQAAQALELLTGEYVGVEKADRCSEGERLVVGSTQSMNQARLDRLGANRFSLVICDEAHRYTSKTYRRSAEFFDAKILGVTATPDRGDEKALGALFESVAYVYEILNAIDDGFLVPIDALHVHLDEVDLREVESSCGDLKIGQLDDVMKKSVEGVTKETLSAIGDRQGLVFWPGVPSAEAAAIRMEALTRPGYCSVVSGRTPDDERRQLIADYRSGALRVLHNCMVLTEGFDAPECSLIAMARPTKSRQLYAQVMGRGLRPSSWALSLLADKEQAAIRKQAIASSSKPDCKILDFAGNAGKHSLVGPADILGGNDEEEVVEKVKERIKKEGGGDVRAMLEAARAAMRLQAVSAQSVVKARHVKYNPFAVLGEATVTRYTRRFGFKPASTAQRNALAKFGMKREDGIDELGFSEASKLLDSMIKRSREGFAPYRILKQLQKWGINETSISFERGQAAMDYLSSTGWGKSTNPARLRSIVGATEKKIG